MKRAAFISLVAMLSSAILLTVRYLSASEPARIDLAHWTPPDIALTGDDPFGELVRYGYALLTGTANEIGPTVADPTKLFSGNNLACQNCHLQAGTQPYAMPLIGIWGQFPQYRGREGASLAMAKVAGRRHDYVPPVANRSGTAQPMRARVAASCARAANGHAAAPRPAMKARRFVPTNIRFPPRAEPS
jgi:hypothetical protein